MNFSFTDKTRDIIAKAPYPVGIHTGNIITNAEYVREEKFEALDITFENPAKGYTFRERLFNPTVNVPSWSTAENELIKFQSRTKHILRRFVAEEMCLFTANSFQEMCENIIAILEKFAIEPKTTFSLKVYWDKNFEYPEIPSKGRFMATEGEPELIFTKWDKTNRLLEEQEVSDKNGQVV